MRQLFLTTLLFAAVIFCLPNQVNAQEEEKNSEGEKETNAETAPATEETKDSPEVPEQDPATLSWEQAWDKGFALYRDHQYSEAIAYLERALALESADPTVRAYLAECYRQTGDEEKAKTLNSDDGDCDSNCEAKPENDCDCQDGDCDCEEGDDDCDCDECDCDDEDCDCEDGDCDCDDEDCDCDCDCDDEDCDCEDGDCDCDDKDCDDDEDTNRPNPLKIKTRKGKPLTIGLTIAGLARTGGVFVELRPVRFVAVQGGIGAGDLRTFFWWAQASLLPIDGPITPTVGAGVLGNLGLNYRASDWSITGTSEYYLGRFTPYLHVGLTLVVKSGFTAAIDFSGLFTGDSEVPFSPWLGVRLGWSF